MTDIDSSASAAVLTQEQVRARLEATVAWAIRGTEVRPDFEALFTLSDQYAWEQVKATLALKGFHAEVTENTLRGAILELQEQLGRRPDISPEAAKFFVENAQFHDGGDVPESGVWDALEAHAQLTEPPAAALTAERLDALEAAVVASVNVADAKGLTEVQQVFALARQGLVAPAIAQQRDTALTALNTLYAAQKTCSVADPTSDAAEPA